MSDATQSVVLVVVAVLAVAAAPMAVADGHTTLSVGDGTVMVGETATVDVTLSAIPDGLSGYNVTVVLSNPDGATITDARIDGYGLNETAISADGSTVKLKAVDVAEKYQSGDGPVRLAVLTVRGESTAGTELTFRVDQVDDDNGDRIAPALDSGQLSVTGADDSTPAENPTETDRTGGNTGDGDAGEDPDDSDTGGDDSAGSGGASTGGGGGSGDDTDTPTETATITQTETTTTETETTTQTATTTATRTATATDTPVDGMDTPTETVTTTQTTTTTTRTTPTATETGGGAPSPAPELGGGTSLWLAGIGVVSAAGGLYWWRQRS